MQFSYYITFYFRFFNLYLLHDVNVLVSSTSSAFKGVRWELRLWVLAVILQLTSTVILNFFTSELETFILDLTIPQGC